MIHQPALPLERKPSQPLDLQARHDRQRRLRGSVSDSPRCKWSRSECEIGDWVVAETVAEWSNKSQRHHYYPAGSSEQWTFLRGTRWEEAGEMAVWVRF
ncbi:hypothetical protein [Luteolibacter sp. Populi]|uniref:hypothetical protein n=1 Tax=Luteolibacter sp. Populi TaxID=3230487 RepID=UPI0034673FDD